MVKRKSTNNDLQNTTQKTIDRVTRDPLKANGELRLFVNKGNNKITELRTILQRESQNS